MAKGSKPKPAKGEIIEILLKSGPQRSDKWGAPYFDSANERGVGESD